MAKTFVGQVVSDKMTKTAVVLVRRKAPHPLYRKVVTKNKKLYADNQIGAQLGQLVEAVETRPLSRLKRFKITKIFDQKKK